MEEIVDGVASRGPVGDDFIPWDLFKVNGKLAMIDGMCVGCSHSDSSPEELGSGVAQELEARISIRCHDNTEEHFG